MADNPSWERAQMLTVGSTEYRFQSSPENAPPEVYKLDRSSGSGQHAMHLIQTLQRRLRPDRSLDDPGVQDRIRQRSEQAKQVKDSQRTVMLNPSEAKGKGKQYSSAALPRIGMRTSLVLVMLLLLSGPELHRWLACFY